MVEEVDPLVGLTLGSFQLMRRLGRGGMGTVYLGEHVSIGSKVAVKVLHEHLARYPELVQRFHAEARAVNLIGHENIVSIFDLNAAPPRPYFIMEYLDGAPLSAWVGMPLPAGAVVTVLSQVCDALQAAHARGIVHRDLKPDNIFLVRRGRSSPFVKVLDFGIAKLRDAHMPQTHAGIIVGTPEYMAPEQSLGRPVDGRADLYAVGVIAYQLVTGKLPFPEEGLTAQLVAHQMRPPPPPRSVYSGVPVAVERVILRALAKTPDARYPDALALKAALQAALTEESRSGAEAPALAVTPRVRVPASGPSAPSSQRPVAPVGGQPRAGAAPGAPASSEARPRPSPALEATPVSSRRRAPASAEPAGAGIPAAAPVAGSSASPLAAPGGGGHVPPPAVLAPALPVGVEPALSPAVPARGGPASPPAAPAPGMPGGASPAAPPPALPVGSGPASEPPPAAPPPVVPEAGRPGAPPAVPASAPVRPRSVELPVQVVLRPGEPPVRLTGSDLSRGGLFLHGTGSLPPLFTRLPLVLELGAGPLSVLCEVVRHVPPEQARVWGMPTGFGVQFVEATQALRAAVDHLLKGGAHPPPSGEPREDDAEAARVLEVWRQRSGGDHYAVLALAPDVDMDTVRARAREAWGTLEPLRLRPLSPSQRACLDAVLARVREAGEALGTTAQRALYDAWRGNHRGVARCLEAGLTGEQLESLRREFLSHRPQAAGTARLHFLSGGALERDGQLGRALERYEQGLALDPLEPGLLQRYRVVRRVLEARARAARAHEKARPL